MAEASWPFFGQETNETQFSKWARALSGGSGITQGLALSAGSGMAVSIAAGAAIVQGVYYENSSAKALTVSAAPGSGTRLDAIILKLDQSTNLVTAEVKAGSVGALPSLTQNETTYEMLIGQVAVASGTITITSGMVTSFFPRLGLRVLPYTSDALRPNPTGEAFALGVQTTAKRLDLWTGAAWVNLFDVGNFSGVLPLSKGGTGKSNALDSRQALEIFIQPTAPAHSALRLWGKSPF